MSTDPKELAAEALKLVAFFSAFPAGVEIPTHIEMAWGADVKWLIFADKADQKARATAIIRGFHGQWDKRENGPFMAFDATHPSGVGMSISVDREQVCERVVTGTREVEKTVPDPDAPLIVVTETVEDVEWVCSPLLAEAASRVEAHQPAATVTA